ncbi:MAG: hypothetical protein WCI05_08180, partial [Myxococcales bacterium]
TRIPTTVEGTSGFERRYFTRNGTLNRGNCEWTGIEATTNAAPTFADALDAMACAGLAASRIDTATVPATYYPYPSASPLCRP